MFVRKICFQPLLFNHINKISRCSYCCNRPTGEGCNICMGSELVEDSVDFADESKVRMYATLFTG